MGKKKSIKREIIEWGIFFGIIATLYLTGLHTPVLGFMQGLILKTGIIKPSIEKESDIRASYSFTLVDQYGEHVDFKNFKGETVFINIWATWCPPCIAEMPDINNLYHELKGENIHFFMISMDDDFEKAKKFVDKKGYDFPIYRLGSMMPEVFHSKAIPTTFVISPKGMIVVKKSGMAKYNTEEFRNYLKELGD